MKVSGQPEQTFADVRKIVVMLTEKSKYVGKLYNSLDHKGARLVRLRS
jgi:hypothetical protein